MNEEIFLEDELRRKLFELGASENERKIALAVADAKLQILSTDIDKIQKRLNKIKEAKAGCP